MATSFGLYYPFIHFKDENWLKLSALYFDCPSSDKESQNRLMWKRGSGASVG
jgi:hypothetical protein